MHPDKGATTGEGGEGGGGVRTPNFLEDPPTFDATFCRGGSSVKPVASVYRPNTEEEI